MTFILALPTYVGGLYCAWDLPLPALLGVISALCGMYIAGCLR